MFSMSSKDFVSSPSAGSFIHAKVKIIEYLPDSALIGPHAYRLGFEIFAADHSLDGIFAATLYTRCANFSNLLRAPCLQLDLSDFQNETARSCD